MTGPARHTRVRVLPVAEEDKVWKLVNPSPGNGFVFFLEACQFLNRRALALDGLVTAHTVSGVRNLRHIACGCRGMADATFQAELAVLLVTERNRLRLHFGRNCHVGGFAPGPGRDDSGFSSTKDSWAALPLGEQGEGENRIAMGLVVAASPSGSDHHELLTRFRSQVGHGSGMAAGFKLGDPQFLSSLLVESPKPPVIGGRNENQTSGGDDGASDVGGPGGRNAFGHQFFNNPQRRLPADSALIQINSSQCTPRRLLARIVPRIPEPAEGVSCRHVRQLAAFASLGHTDHLRGILGIDKKQIGNRIVRGPSPVWPAHGARENDGGLEARRLIGLPQHTLL